MKTATFLFMAAIAAAFAATGGDARAAESYDNCTGTIPSLPVVISTQGTWCLTADLATAVTSGSAIKITTNNVTIDCNGFKLGGLAAGASTATSGIRADARTNIVVRGCNIRGFWLGVAASGSSLLFEDNRFEGNTFRALSLTGDAITVRRNQVIDTGGSTTGAGTAYGIYLGGSGDVVDNSIGDVLARTGSGATAWGIYVLDSGEPSQINLQGNRVRGVLGDGAGASTAIRSVSTGRIVIRANALFGSGAGIGVQCAATTGVVRDNSLLSFTTALSGCSNDGGNIVKP